jgi:long-subunit acyl-CoA synthetase (AMP-forming)
MQVPYLGQRQVDEKGKAGPYRWMTYKEAATARTEIGSGLLHYGLSPGAAVGLYSVNCRGARPAALRDAAWLAAHCLCIMFCSCLLR